MKNLNKIVALLLLSSIAILNAQTVKIGSQTNGITASGNSLSINNGNTSVQVSNVPAWMTGVTNAAQATMQETSATLDKNADGTAKNTPENQAKIEAAKNNFLKQKQELITQAVVSSLGKDNSNGQTQANQIQVKVGQDLNVMKSTLKSTLVTNNIAFYNNTTMNQIELKAQKENSEMYEKFPEYLSKDF